MTKAVQPTIILTYFTIITLIILSCTGNNDNKSGFPVAAGDTETQKMIEFSYLALGKPDPILYEEGKNVFLNKCLRCHELDKKKVGPPLRFVTRRHSAEWIMDKMESVIKFNDMVERKLYDGDSIKNFIPSRSQIPVTTPEERRAVIEFLRKEGKSTHGKADS